LRATVDDRDAPVGVADRLRQPASGLGPVLSVEHVEALGLAVRTTAVTAEGDEGHGSSRLGARAEQVFDRAAERLRQPNGQHGARYDLASLDLLVVAPLYPHESGDFTLGEPFAFASLAYRHTPNLAP
jgi:hypothetical protein